MNRVAQDGLLVAPRISAASFDTAIRRPNKRNKITVLELSEQSMDLPSVLTAICDRVFHSSAFRKWLASVIGAHLRVTQGQVRCFRPGLDYTLAIQNPTSASEKFSLNLCFVNDFGNDDEKSWSSGDVGGYLCHMKTKPFEKMSTPAEVYMEER